MYVHATEPCRGRRTVLWHFSPPILLEVPGIGLRSPGLCSKYSYSLSHCAGPLSARLSVLLTQVRVLQHSAKMQLNSSPIKVHLASGGTGQDCTGLPQGLNVQLLFSLFVQPCVEVVFFRNYSPHLGRIPICTVLPLRLSSGNDNSASSKALTKYVLDVSRLWTRHGGLGTEQHQ